MSYLSDSYDAALKDIERLQHQRDQLREALGLMAIICPAETEHERECVKIARAALKATEEG